MADPDEKKLKYDVIAQQINREDELVSKRLSWSLTINGFLFAALGLVAGKQSPNEEILKLFQVALPATGILVSFAALLGVVAANIQIFYLTKEWAKLNDMRWVRPFGDKQHAFFMGYLPSMLPPVVLVVVWVCLLWAWH